MLIHARISAVSLFVSLALGSTAAAQGVTRGSIDLSANGGITNLGGVDNKRGHGSFGFAAGYNLTRHFAVQADYNYLLLGSLTEQGVTGKENLQMYGAAARLSIIDTRFVAPYVLFGGGGVRDNATASEGNVSVSGSQSGGYATVGGGVSIYAGHGFGIRPEFRYDRLQFQATELLGVDEPSEGKNSLRATVALFYQFGGRKK